jgi:type VI protein secretion system component VasF
MTPEEQSLIRRRQRARAKVMAVLLGALVLLVFAISFAKIKMNMPV